MTPTLQIFLILALGTAAVRAVADEVVVIVNPSNTISTMTVDQVEQIYLGKTTTLPAGGYANAVDLADGSALRDAFYQKAAGRSRTQVKAVWTRLLFSGKNTPPRAFSTSAEVKEFVASNPNAIGYVEKSAADSSVKVVLTLP